MPVYIIHLSTPLKHARHYVGWASDVEARIAEHRATTWEPVESYTNAKGRKVTGKRSGNGSTFIGAANYFQIPWELARVFKRGTRAFERKLKNTHSVADYCPLCQKDSKGKAYHPKKGEKS